MANNYLILPTADIVMCFNENLWRLNNTDYDMHVILTHIVGSCLKYDVGECVNEDVLRSPMGVSIVDEEDMQVYFDACITFAVSLNSLFRRCHLYHNNYLPFIFDRLVCDDIVLKPEENLRFYAPQNYRGATGVFAGVL